MPAQVYAPFGLRVQVGVSSCGCRSKWSFTLYDDGQRMFHALPCRAARLRRVYPDRVSVSEGMPLPFLVGVLE